MVRSISGVVVGYVVMFIFIFLTFTGLYFLLGADGSFEADTYDVSTIWIVISFVLSIAAAVIGGYVCTVIAKNEKAPLVLAGIVFILGIIMAIPVLSESADEVYEMRKAEVSNMEAMQKAKQPPIVLLLNPIIGAIGVFAGSRLKKTDEV
jgi:magnesium-transporting ATPase (P-type)